ncbi:MAG TPA: hypothetical protein VF666_07855 [Pyrinomonadaceae bacterium]|jgi:hypothetical protein
MGSNGKEALQRTLAILVIMAMLNMMGIPLTVIIFFSVVVFFVWRAVQRSEQQDIRGIFDFYIAANEILRDEERRWYGFEIAEAIERGDRVVRAMYDPPPLVHFTLGALYNRAGDHEAAVEHLAYVTENDLGDEARRFTHSPELQRYVQVLRRLEREPAEAPQTMSAIRSLERARRTRAAAMLEESRQRLNINVASITPTQPASVTSHQTNANANVNQISTNRPASLAPAPPQMPPPISEVLRDVYEEEKKTA